MKKEGVSAGRCELRFSDLSCGVHFVIPPALVVRRNRSSKPVSQPGYPTTHP